MGAFGIGIYQPISQLPPGVIKSSVITGSQSGGIPGVTTLLYDYAVQQDMPVIYYPLNDPHISYRPLGPRPFGINVADRSGHGYIGQIHGGATLGYASGPLQGPGEAGQTCLMLDGTSGYLTYPSFDPGALGWGQMTIETWINPSSIPSTTNPRILCNSHTDIDHKGLQLFLKNNGTLAVNLGDGVAETEIDSINPIPLGAWTHAVATWDGQQLLLYVNAQIQGGSAFTGLLSAGSTVINIGRNQVYNGDYFAGLIGPTVLYQGVLAPTDILYHYDVGLTHGATVVGTGWRPGPGPRPVDPVHPNPIPSPPGSGIYGGQYGYVVYTTIRGPKVAQPLPAPTIGNDNLGRPVVRSYPSVTWNYSSLRPDYWYYFRWLYKLAGQALPGYQYLVLLQQPDMSGNNVPVMQLARWDPPVHAYRNVGAYMGVQLKFTYLGQAMLAPGTPIVTVAW